MSKVRIGLLMIPVAMALATAAYAGGGTKSVVEPSISQSPDDPLRSVATGALTTARMNPSNSNSVQTKEIGCEVFAYSSDSETDTLVFCFATMPGPEGSVRQFACQSSDPNIVAAAASINANSMVTFEAVTIGSAGGGSTKPTISNECFSLSVDNSSKYWQAAN